MARKSKFEDEKNKLDLVRKRLDEAIEEAENMQHSHGGNDDYKQALIYQGFAKTLREIKMASEKEKTREVANEIGD